MVITVPTALFFLIGLAVLVLIPIALLRASRGRPESDQPRTIDAKHHPGVQEDDQAMNRRAG